jgi:hypothetical protein
MKKTLMIVMLIGAVVPELTQASFNFLDFNSTAGLGLVGDATQYGNRLRLTLPDRFQVGAAWYTTKELLTEGFETTFQFQITGVGGVLNATGADGFAFVIQNHHVSALGGAGGDSEGIGYGGIPNSLAIEFDTWQNSSDPDDNHISVHTRKTNPNNADESYSIGFVTAILNMSDGNVHVVKIEYVPGTLRIFLDDLQNPTLTILINLATTLSLDNGQAWVGFTASTGNEWENHDILSWAFLSGVTPRRDTEVVIEEQELPTTYTLFQNYPNPFNPETTISYDLPEMAHVRLVVHDLSGQAIRTLVHDAHHQPGRYAIVWDGRDDEGQEVASGIYFYRLEAVDRGFMETRRMLLIR